MRKINSLISNLPVFIIYWWLGMLIISHTNFYYKYYTLIDKIDTYVIIFLLMHLLFFSKFYSNKKIIFVITILIILQIQLINIYVNNTTYFLMYTIAILSPIICSILYIKKKH